MNKPPQEPTLTTVQFAALAHHLEEQIRGSTDRATVNRYRLAMQNGEVFPSLIVAKVGGALVLVDGFHRRDAMEALGLSEASAHIVSCVSLKEARWLGFDANLRHGQPLKAKLLRPAFQAYIEAGHHRPEYGRAKSYRDIAAELPGVSYSTVRRWMKADFLDVFWEMGGAEGQGPGGCYPLPIAQTPEEQTLESALGYIAEARALLHGVASREARRRAAVVAKELVSDLTWDDDRAGGLDLSAF